MPAHRERPRYRFAGFVVSPSRRLLLHQGRELPLIPRYFDLLVLLLERRNEAVTRRDIFESVWRDVVVSDGALSQAVRTLRRTLSDDPREPAFIRTVSRHGYRFVFADVIEESDVEPLSPEAKPENTAPDGMDEALRILLEAEDESSRRDAAQSLHALGVEEALRRLGNRPGHERARAILRDARWDLPTPASVPVWTEPGALRTLAALFRLRLQQAYPLMLHRWAGAVVGGGAAGLVAGIIGGTFLFVGPGSLARLSVVPVLGIVGLIIGSAGAAGVGAGLAAAEVLVRSARAFVLVTLGAIGGGMAGGLAHLLARWALEGLFGRDLSPVAGGFEGIVLGGATGLGYALATPVGEGGMASPRGAKRALAAVAAGLACSAAAVGLVSTGSYLGAMSLDLMAHSFPGSQVALDPLARLLGEGTPGFFTRTVISAWEGLLFGSGVVWGLTRRPRGH